MSLLFYSARRFLTDCYPTTADVTQPDGAECIKSAIGGNHEETVMKKLILASASAIALFGIAACSDTADNTTTQTTPPADTTEPATPPPAEATPPAEPATPPAQ
jgi:hypothetical protein